MIKKINEHRTFNKNLHKNKLKEALATEIGNLEYTSLIPKEDLNAINQFIKGCKKVADYINANDYLVEYTDAKLHDVFYQFDDVDDLFLQIEWETFEEYCKDLDVEIDFLRSSGSKFYINDDDGFLKAVRDNAEDRRGYYDIDWITIADAIDYVYAYGTFYMEFFESDEKLNNYLKDAVMDEYEHNTMEEIKEAVEEIVREDSIFDIRQFTPEVNNIMKVLDGPKKAHEYIESFKENQVQIYQDFLDANA